MVILHVPALAAGLMALHFRRRLFYVDHVAVALHSWAFILLHGMATPFLLTLFFRVTGGGSQGAFQLAMALVVILYFWQQVRVAYGQPGWVAAAKLPVLLVGFAVSHFCSASSSSCSSLPQAELPHRLYRRGREEGVAMEWTYKAWRTPISKLRPGPT